ncbi:MAG: hypothetical protein HQ523_03960 [Lentisphaerae bacterium]|nr:hypothetical protein [Lentisphaerota bacterium]
MKSRSGCIYLLGILLMCLSAGFSFGKDGAKTSKMSIDQAHDVVTRAYEKILKRPVDPSGMANFVPYLTEGGKDAAWLQGALKESPEYLERVKNQKQDRINFSIIAVIVVVVGAIFFFPRKKDVESSESE